MATSTQIREWWSEWRCNQSAMQPLSLFGRHVGTVPPATIDAYLALETVLLATGYGNPDSVWTYNCRKIGGSNTWSLHAYGLAVDIDPALNPYSNGDPFAGKFTPTQVEAVEAIRNTTGGQVWSWGGRWSKPDRMHWQINVPQTGLDIDPTTVEGVNAVSHEHTPPAGQIHSWADDAWDKWVTRSGTDPDTRGWNFQREDLSWVYTRVIEPLEDRVAALEARVAELEQPTGGGIPDGSDVILRGTITTTT